MLKMVGLKSMVIKGNLQAPKKVLQMCSKRLNIEHLYWSGGDKIKFQSSSHTRQNGKG